MIPSDVLLYLNQKSAIRYLSFDVTGFTVLYVSLFVYALVNWKSKRLMGYLIVASIVTFSASAPFLWISGGMAVVLMAVSIYCLDLFWQDGNGVILQWMHYPLG